MDGPQDLGGRMGFGPVEPEADEPVFHAPWEARTLAVTLACGALGHWTLDESRHARESLPPADYLSYSYYKIWITALEALLQKHGEVSGEELAAGRMLSPGLRPERRMQPADVAPTLARGGPTDRPETAPARFAVGDRVRTRNHNPTGHTRLPSYARQKVGTIKIVHTPHVYPDSNAHGDGEQPQYLYTVAFDAATLWGDDAAAGHKVNIDAWESYLDPA